VKDFDRLRANLIRLRARNELTQAELAKLTGVTAANISFWEHGVTTPTLSKFEKLAKALKVNAASLLMGRCKPIHRGPQGPKPSEVVGDNITLYRLERLMTQAKLAKVSGTTQRIISLLERSKQGSTLTTLQKLAKGLRLGGIPELLRKPPAEVLRIRKYVQLGSTYTWRGYQAI
jgi:transcriptional regulator with XRE-family HTH domain